MSQKPSINKTRDTKPDWDALIKFQVELEARGNKEIPEMKELDRLNASGPYNV
jgi:hypothetical protein